MNLDVVTTILEQAGIGVLGETLFQDHMPDAAVEGCMVRLPVDGVPMSAYIPGYFRVARLQVVVRAGGYDTGKALADKVFRVLTISMETDYADENGAFLMHINTMRPVSLPIVYARSPGNLIEWSLNFEANYVMALPG